MPKVKLAAGARDPVTELKRAFRDDDAVLFRKILRRHPALKTRIDEPIGPFDSPAITLVRSRAMLDVLVEAGADINAKSRWWAGGFGLLHNASPELAAYAITRGAVVDVHAAARLGLLDRLRALLSANPDLVHARGGDGQTPLHFAGTIAVAECLLEHATDIDALDVDHESTPAQFMARDRQDVARLLVRRGCRTDLLLATALGDTQRVRRHLEEDPDCIRLRVSDEFFPRRNPRSGGTIYQWTLGWHVSAHDVARQFGHRRLLDLLMRRSPPEVRLLAACWLGDDAAVRALIRRHPGLAAGLRPTDNRQMAHAARNNNRDAVRLMLECGLPADAVGQHGGTPLHWAAWHGNADLVRLLLRYHPPLEKPDTDFRAPPLGWAIHGSENGWHCETGDYAATVEALIRAGARLPETPAGSRAVRAALRRHGVKEPEKGQS